MTQPVRTETLLADRGWRWRHSLWLLAPLLTCGLLGGFGFVYVWARVRSRAFARGALFGVLSSTAIWLLSSIQDSAGTIRDIPMGLILALLAAQLAYGVVLNRQYLQWHAARSAAGPWYAQPQPMPSPRPTLQPPPGPAPRPPAPAPLTGDTHHDLQRRLDALAVQVHSGTPLPSDVVASLDRLFAQVRDILARSRSLATSPDHLYLVNRVVTDYVPTSLNAYASLPRGYASTARLRSGRTPHTELLHQLDLLHGELDDIAQATYAGDSAKLEAQGRFLEDRFRESELDLS